MIASFQLTFGTRPTDGSTITQLIDDTVSPLKPHFCNKIMKFVSDITFLLIKVHSAALMGVVIT